MKKNMIWQLVLVLFCATLVYFFPHIFNPTAKQNVLALTANDHITLFIEPKAGISPLLTQLNAAQSEILVVMYLLTDKQIITALEQAQQRGVNVKVMLEENPYQAGSLSQQTYKILTAAKVPVAWSNQDFALTHEKAVIIDQKTLFVLNQNLTTSAFKKNREYNMIDTDLQDVMEARNIFQSDWDRSPVTLTTSHLIVSPYNSRASLEKLIKTASSSADIELEVLTDPEMVSLLKEESQHKTIRIILADFGKVEANKPIAEDLQRSGIQVKTLKTPYIHAKLIIADQKTAYTGSINFTTQSLDKNRELGILVSQENVIQGLVTAFESDWLLAE